LLLVVLIIWAVLKSPFGVEDNDGFHETHPCQHEGCLSTDTTKCVLRSCQWREEDLIEYYCSDHAQEHGYCYGCGGFYAGIDSFDFSKTGLCEICLDQVMQDFAEFEYDEVEDDYFNAYYPGGEEYEE
jgi:hypothetical protein